MKKLKENKPRKVMCMMTRHPKGPGTKVKNTQVTNSQVSRDSAKSVNRKSSAWQNHFSILSGDDESCDSETLENQAQSCSTKTSNVQESKDKNTVKENQRNKDWKKNKRIFLLLAILW